MGMVPKGPRANVRWIDSTRNRAKNAQPAFGRGDSEGYDPSTGDTHGSKYKERTKDAATEHDVFALVEHRGYTEDRFYCRSVNAEGHGEKLNVRVPQGIDSQIHAAVAGIPEYRTLHDFFRDAAIHRLEYLQKRYDLGEGGRRVLELQRIAADMAKNDTEIETMQESVRDIEEKCQRAWDSGDYAMLVEQMEEASQAIDWMREPYKTRASTVLQGWRGKSKTAIAKLRQQMEE